MAAGLVVALIASPVVGGVLMLGLIVWLAVASWLAGVAYGRYWRREARGERE